MLNGTRFVSDQVAARIKTAIKELNFRPNFVAQNLRSGKSKLIGFLACNLKNYFYVNIANGIEKTIAPSGYRLIIVDSAENKHSEMDYVESLYLRGLDGLIIVPTHPDCNYLQKVVDPSYPLVFIDRQPVNFEADTILLDNVDASYMATKYFISKNYRDIGFLSFHYCQNEIDITMQERIEGYTKALKEAEIPINSEAIKTMTGFSVAVNELHYTESYKMMEQLLQIPVRAVLCGDGPSAIGAYSYLKDNNISIPEQISLITYDDDIWLRLTTPKISSVVQPAESFGILAAWRLLNRIEGKKLPIECFRLKAEMVLRES
jgi:LacI family transcriptional regulator